jgi:asparagine N-glycosylation enzyme membrane subunit Stt3
MGSIDKTIAGPDSDQAFFRFATGSTAVAFAVVFGAMESLRVSGSGFTFHLSLGTGVAAAIGAAVALIYWKIILRDRATKNHLRTRVASILLLLAGVGLFLYPLRFVPKNRLSEISQGLIAAVVVVSAGGCTLWRIKRHLEKDSAQPDKF